MNPITLFIGSIGVVAETSELQRQAYNGAMAENNIAWEWSREVYKELLKSSGGKSRLHLLSAATDHKLSDDLIEKIHTGKTAIAGELIKEQSINPRPGLVSLIKQAKNSGAKVAWVTTTGEENTSAILDAVQTELPASYFDYIFHREDAENGKPSPDIYHAALKRLQITSSSCIAIEDSLNSILAAKVAGIFTVASLGAYHNEPVENIADLILPSLDETNWTELIQEKKRLTSK